MSIETRIAAKGAKATWEGIKVVVFAIALLVVTGVLGWLYVDGKKRREELEGLQAFRTSVEERDRVSAAANKAYDTAKAEAAQQEREQVKVIIEHEQATEEARREDPTVDDFLRAPIPQRLRDADARARRADRLGEDQAGH